MFHHFDLRCLKPKKPPQPIEFLYLQHYMDLDSCDISRWIFNDCDLRESNFKDAIMNKTSFCYGTNLSFCDFSGCDLRTVDLLLTYHAYFSIFVNANLRGLDLSRMHLEGAKFNNADLRGVNFRGAHLGGAVFSGARTEGFELFFEFAGGVQLPVASYEKEAS